MPTATPARPPIERIRFRALPTQRFVDFWRRMRGDVLLPRISDYDPSAIPTLSAMVMQREVRPDGSAIYRQAGAGVVAMFGKDLTGGNAVATIPPKSREQYRCSSRLMFRQPCGILALFSVKMTSGRRVLVENVGFPFVPEADGVLRTISHMAIGAGLPAEG